ncbi:hypothetical protein H0H93_002635 [Arthromyces matolae]|nr:hypothetical protein H0H93_002635 [Arthromyces matolae]
MAPSIPLDPDYTFTPSYNGRPDITASDPFGLLPLRRVVNEYKSTACVHWDPNSRALKVWAWPTIDNRRVHPSELRKAFIKYSVRGPCCLCASQMLPIGTYTEAAIFIPQPPSQLHGEYVAACANGKCKYWAPNTWVPPEVVYIELNSMPATPSSSNTATSTSPSVTSASAPVITGSIKSPLASVTTTAPSASAPVASSNTSQSLGKRNHGVSILDSDSIFDSSENEADAEPENFFVARAKIFKAPKVTQEVELGTVASAPPVKRRRVEDMRALTVLMKLDSSISPGLTEIQLKRVLVQCLRCKLIMTQSALNLSHDCPVLVLQEILQEKGGEGQELLDKISEGKGKEKAKDDDNTKPVIDLTDVIDLTQDATESD